MKMPRQEQVRRERREREVSKSPQSSWKRKLALAGMLVSGISTQFERFSRPEDANTEEQQEMSPEEYRHLESERKKLLMAAKVLSEIRLPDTTVTTEDREAEIAHREHWFELHAALQNARIDTDQVRNNRSREHDEYKSLPVLISHHPEAMDMFDANIDKVKIEYGEDGIYAHLEGKNGFDLVVNVDTDPRTGDAVLVFSDSDETNPYSQQYRMEDLLDAGRDVEEFIEMKLRNAIEEEVILATKRDVQDRYPDYQEPHVSVAMVE